MVVGKGVRGGGDGGHIVLRVSLVLASLVPQRQRILLILETPQISRSATASGGIAASAADLIQIVAFQTRKLLYRLCNCLKILDDNYQWCQYLNRFDGAQTRERRLLNLCNLKGFTDWTSVSVGLCILRAAYRLANLLV